MSRAKRRGSRNVDKQQPEDFRPGEDYIACAHRSDVAKAHLERKILEFGWTVVTVLADKRMINPPMAYTAGLLENFNHPELIVFGLEAVDSLAVLNGLASRFVQAGTPVPLDVPIEKVFVGHLAVAKVAKREDAERYALFAEERARRSQRPFCVEQIVWSDDAGRFPWDERYDHSFDRIQPLLFDSLGSNQDSVSPGSRLDS